MVLIVHAYPAGDSVVLLGKSAVVVAVLLFGLFEGANVVDRFHIFLDPGDIGLWLYELGLGFGLHY